jgi:hypothetical protein
MKKYIILAITLLVISCSPQLTYTEKFCNKFPDGTIVRGYEVTGGKYPQYVYEIEYPEK